MEEITNNTKEVQRIAFGILKYVDKVCRENNIKYSLAGGTLLGAVRHKGFIPWDDDIDIMMLRPEYEKFLKIMDEDAKTNEKYKLLHFGKNFPNYFYRFAKVVDLDTSVSESTFIIPKDMGVYVDIFPVDDIDIKNLNRIIRKNSHLCGLLCFSANTKNTPSKNGILKKIIKPFAVIFAKIFGYKFWARKNEKFATSFNNKNFNYVHAFSGAYGIKDVYPKKYYENYVELEFENLKCLAIADWDLYLTQLYNDYMKLPPVEQQVSHHDLKIYKK